MAVLGITWAMSWGLPGPTFGVRLGQLLGLVLVASIPRYWVKRYSFNHISLRLERNLRGGTARGLGAGHGGLGAELGNDLEVATWF